MDRPLNLEEVLRELQVLVGQPLTDMWRYAGLQRFEFGPQMPHLNRKGEHISRSDYALVAQTWSVSGDDGWVLSSQDFTSESRRDENAGPFYDSLQSANTPVCSAVHEVAYGVLTVSLRGLQDYILSIKMSDEWLFLTSDHSLIWHYSKIYRIASQD